MVDTIEVSDYAISIMPLLLGWVMDMLFGDPMGLPHPVVGFGKVIAGLEKLLNRGGRKAFKGACMAVGLVVATYVIASLALNVMDSFVWLRIAVESILVYYCLAGTTLIREVKMVFLAVERSLADGRRQVGRIVGRDTDSLSAQEIRTAALETLAENLSDGVIAPLFWYMLLGVPGMLAYKMVNTLDSMVGYRNERYRKFGRVAARIDDAANYLPARLTAVLMVLAKGSFRLLRFVWKFGGCHASPNSGYPEAALAGILDCRFGGSHDYFGESVYKPYIGNNPRCITMDDMVVAVAVNRRAEVMMVALVVVVKILIL
ncbi:MAG: adenosylcobinamide-phosphate synthase CbiB [Duncaniella sp.]|nr:adenosylcobinamide-phosphate synthase CbiB [Duncaniella sp.]